MLKFIQTYSSELKLILESLVLLFGAGMLARIIKLHGAERKSWDSERKSRDSEKEELKARHQAELAKSDVQIERHKSKVDEVQSKHQIELEKRDLQFEKLNTENEHLKSDKDEHIALLERKVQFLESKTPERLWNQVDSLNHLIDDMVSKHEKKLSEQERRSAENIKSEVESSNLKYQAELQALRAEKTQHTAQLRNQVQRTFVNTLATANVVQESLQNTQQWVGALNLGDVEKRVVTDRISEISREVGTVQIISADWDNPNSKVNKGAFFTDLSLGTTSKDTID